MSMKNIKIILMVLVVTCVFSEVLWAEAARNPLITAPEISPIAVDGDLSDWDDASAWATFGGWYNGSLDNASRAQYAWNDANMLYIGVESREPRDLVLEVGGLMGNLSDPSADPNSSSKTTQIEFKYSGGTIAITNQMSGEITTGVIASHTWDGTIMTIEIAVPIYSDWTNSGSAMTLSDGMDVYVYANVLDSDPDPELTFGDSQVTSGTYIALSFSETMDVASRVRLYGPPSECGELGTEYLTSDLDNDCYVTLADFATLAADWMECTDPAPGSGCDP